MTTTERTVWKFPLSWSSPNGKGFPVTECFVGKDAKVVLIGQDVHNVLCAWIEHTVQDEVGDTTGGHIVRLIITGTGHSIPDEAEHVGSAITGNFVWHVYQVPA